MYLDILPSLAGNGVIFKCDRCYDRLNKGEMPACIEACPENAQIIGPREEILQKAHAIAREIDGYIYGETENGGTNTMVIRNFPGIHMQPQWIMFLDLAHLVMAMIFLSVTVGYFVLKKRWTIRIEHPKKEKK